MQKPESFLKKQEALQTGKPLYTSYEEFPRTYVSKSQCKQLLVPLKENEKPIAYLWKALYNGYMPLYDRTGNPVWQLPFYPQHKKPKGYMLKRVCGQLKCPVKRDEKPIAFLELFEGYFALYDRSNDPRWRLKLLRNPMYDPLDEEWE